MSVTAPPEFEGRAGPTSGESGVTPARSGLLAVLVLATAFWAAALSAAASAQAAGRWLQEFTERRAEWGGDIRYAILDAGQGQSLQLGCTPNRIERILVVFPQTQGVPAALAPSPEVRYAIDGGAMQPADWRLFEAGSLEVPRGGESARLTRQLAAASRLRVEAGRGDGGWTVADFDLSGIAAVVPPMLQACGLEAR